VLRWAAGTAGGVLICGSSLMAVLLAQRTVTVDFLLYILLM
jgi:hypothetical protein